MTMVQRLLGPDDPTVKSIFGAKSPADLAADLVDKSGLKDLGVRKKLLDGGAAAINASKDPMILFAKRVDADARAVRKDFEDNVDAPLVKNFRPAGPGPVQAVRHIGRPGCDFTLRLSYGLVKGMTRRAAMSRPSPPWPAHSTVRPAPRRSSCRKAG